MQATGVGIGRPPGRADGALRVTLLVFGGAPLFLESRVAAPVFRRLVAHPETLAACLLPDRLLWMLAGHRECSETVRQFKAVSAGLARWHGHRGRLWRRGYRVEGNGSGSDVLAAALDLLEAPARRGLTDDARTYPYQILRIDWFGR